MILLLMNFLLSEDDNEDWDEDLNVFATALYSTSTQDLALNSSSIQTSNSDSFSAQPQLQILIQLKLQF